MHETQNSENVVTFSQSSVEGSSGIGFDRECEEHLVQNHLVPTPEASGNRNTTKRSGKSNTIQDNQQVNSLTLS